jgi:hypothetical protein
MARDTVSYAPLQIVAGDSDIRSKQVVIAANAGAIAALTPLKRDANYKCVLATAITDEIVGILVPGADSTESALTGLATSASDQYAFVYTHGDFFADKINFASITTATDNSKKDAVFDATGINIKFTGTTTQLLD